MQVKTQSHSLCSWIGPDAYFDWLESCKSHQKDAVFDVVLITHPRNEDDLPRMFPWSKNLEHHERTSLTRHLKPAFGEVLETKLVRVGILFLPVYAKDIIHPSTRSASRKILQDGLRLASQAGARFVCLGGLTGSLSLYGKKLAALAQELGITLTTGHSVTSISVLETYLRSIHDLAIAPLTSKMVILGAGSVGGAFARLLLQQSLVPRELILVDKPSRTDHLSALCETLQKDAEKTKISFELTTQKGEVQLNSSCYDCRFLVTAVSSWHVIDIDNIAPGTILIDDSQPYCWDREKAWNRCREYHDLVPCEAGLIDCHSIGYLSRFPFDFAEQDEYGLSSTAWSCLAEGLLLSLKNELPTTIGEPSIQNILSYYEAFKQFNFHPPALQCGQNKLPIEALKSELS